MILRVIKYPLSKKKISTAWRAIMPIILEIIKSGPYSLIQKIWLIWATNTIIAITPRITLYFECIRISQILNILTILGNYKRIFVSK